MTVASNTNALLRVPGRLCLAPTDLTLPFPGGGTDLGLVADIFVRPGRVVKKLREEGLGSVVVAGIDLGEAWALTAAVRALEQGHEAVFFTTATGAVSGEPTIVHNPLTHLAGAALAPVSLMFWPMDDLQQLCVWFPAALAYPDVAAAMAKSIERPGLVLVAFDATPRASDGLAVWKAKKEDLVLT